MPLGLVQRLVTDPASGFAGAADADRPTGSMALDPELEALPEPRRPWRRLTFATMAVTAAASAGLAIALLGLVAFSLESGPPRNLGSLTSVQLDGRYENRWVRGSATLSAPAIEYRRPLEPDRFRLAPVEGSGGRIWVESRIPSELDSARFVPPTSFVGRLIPFSRPGLLHVALDDAVERAGAGPVPEGAWLLADGEAPQGSRWVLGVFALLVLFVAFNVWGIVHLLRPVRDDG